MFVDFLLNPTSFSPYLTKSKFHFTLNQYSKVTNNKLYFNYNEYVYADEKKLICQELKYIQTPVLLILNKHYKILFAHFFTTSDNNDLRNKLMDSIRTKYHTTQMNNS